MKEYVSLDLETHRIGPGQIAPPIVSVAWQYQGEEVKILGSDDVEAQKKAVLKILEGDHTIIGSNIAFDMGCIVAQWPEFFPLTFSKYRRNEVEDLALREKLHILGTTGNPDFITLPDGSEKRLSYSQAALEKKYLFIDRIEAKTDGDAWRLNYSMLDGVPVSSWPEEAVEYAAEDVDYALQLALAQDAAPLENQSTSAFQAASAFSLFLFTMVGWRVDHNEVEKLREYVEREMDEENYDLLTESGILRPSVPPREKRGGGLTKEKKASVNRKLLQAQVEQVSADNDIELEYTATGGISTAAGVIVELSRFCPVLKQYKDRQAIAKLSSTYLPQFFWDDEPVDRIHGSYDALKRTGRTSSYASKLFPSTNIQQIDPRVRSCYIADPGFVLVACDYSALELRSAAWRMKQLFGRSKLYDLIKKGKDPHAYTGMLLMNYLDSDFRESTKDLSNDQKYEVFQRLAETHPDQYKHYRTFAKPTGLGYLGGLGPETFVQFSKAVYGFDVEALAQEQGMDALELAENIRNVWLDGFPDIEKYLKSYVKNDWGYTDPWGERLYEYDTPLGMIRRGCTYTAAANGGAMQSPAAEGAKAAVFAVQEAAWACPENPLYGSIPLAFIHDEIIIESPEAKAHEAAEELARIMVREMEGILEGVQIEAEPLLMTRWDKSAKPMYDESGRLIPYHA